VSAPVSQDGLSSPTEPSSTVSALTGFDPSRRPEYLTNRLIGHREASEALQRLINSHFRNPDGARVSIPANPDRDDDLVMHAYIWQRATGDWDRSATSEAGDAQ
jgi:hypothetical protein